MIRTALVVLTLSISTAALGSAQPAPIAVGDLTEEQWESLSAEQRIVSGDMEISLGELRARDAAQRAAYEERARERRAEARRGLIAARDQAEARASEVARQQRALTAALLAHFQRFAAAHPEAVRAARELSARRAAAHERWLRASAPPPSGRPVARPVNQ